MKKVLCLLLAAVLVFAFAACGGSGQGGTDNGSSDFEWTRTGHFIDENDNYLMILPAEDEEHEGLWAVTFAPGDEMHGWFIPQEGETLHGDLTAEGIGEDPYIVTISEEGDGILLVNEEGTSNVYFAKKFNLTPIGTYAHEFVQMYQGINSIPLAYTNHFALDDWYAEFQGDNGTCLSDTLTTDLFLRDFNRSMVNNYTGVRHDSGDPYEWGEKLIKHFEKYGVDPMTKTLLFSDGLTFDYAQEIADHFAGRTKTSFGIGTFVSNDTCVPALNIVIKLQYVNGNPVAKLSDSPGKAMCDDPDYLEYLKNAVAFRLERETY